MQMHNPPHPGETLRDDVLPALGLSVTAVAEQLGVTRVTLSRVLHGQSAISPEMALRLERWLGVDYGGRASVWLGMQAAYDLWNAERSARAVLKQIKPVDLAALLPVGGHPVSSAALHDRGDAAPAESGTRSVHVQ